MGTDSDLSVSTAVRPFVRVREKRTSVREPHVRTPSARRAPMHNSRCGSRARSPTSHGASARPCSANRDHKEPTKCPHADI